MNRKLFWTVIGTMLIIAAVYGRLNSNGTDPCDNSDRDSDGFSECGGDCNDGWAYTYPDAPEFCDLGQDNDCDGLVGSEKPNCIELSPPRPQESVEERLNDMRADLEVLKKIVRQLQMECRDNPSPAIEELDEKIKNIAWPRVLEIRSENGQIYPAE